MEKAIALREQRKRDQASREAAAYEPPPEPPKAESVSSPYSVGQTVEAKYSNGEWYSAVVVEISSSGHAVRFEDGFEVNELTTDDIRCNKPSAVAAKVASPVAAAPSPEAEAPPEHLDSMDTSSAAFAVNDVVEAKFSNGEWYTAVVLTVKGDGYGVRFEDGIELVLSEADMRGNKPPEPPPPAVKSQKPKRKAVAPQPSAEPPAQPAAQRAAARSGAAFKKGDDIEAKYSNGE